MMEGTQSSPIKQLYKPKIWVLAPYLETNEENIDYYYDFSHSKKEYEKVFNNLQLPWEWKEVTNLNFKSTIDEISQSQTKQTPIVLNLCDGDEINGAPGISVIHYLKEKKLRFTGSDIRFYENTTSKIVMKKIFDQKAIAHASWKAIHHPEQPLKDFPAHTGLPFIVKPAISGGSMGLGTKNVIQDESELYPLVQSLFEGYKGWDFTYGGLVAESFINGPEYTTFIIGSYMHPELAIIYTPVERLFHDALPDTEKFLSFDRLWETYEKESPVNDKDDFYQYRPVPASLEKAIKEISWDAYCAVEGTGYGRVDIRMDKNTGNLYVLEVNAQCGLSEDENYTSIGAISRIGNHPYYEMIAQILEDACLRYNARNIHQNFYT
jgi:D-alanine-D-alanine ligase